jgi:UDP-N-acetylmuramoyl-tripeptide--D-alanyl-D-alanine ligase
MTIPQLYQQYLAHPIICTDTRSIIKGSLFFALKGDNFNANNFAEKALIGGAAFAIIDDAKYKIDDRFILVDDVLTTLQELAKHHRKQLNIPVIGLTGSNGKTTNLNNHIGVPLTILELKPDTEIAIIEMGANHQKEIEMLCQICLPTHGLITNVGKAHLEGFGGFEGVKKGKGELYDYLETSGGITFLNQDNEHLIKMASARKLKDIITYGTSNSNDISGELLQNNLFLEVNWFFKNEKHNVKSQMTGIYNFENILVAVAIGKHFGLSAEEINKGIATYSPQNNRSQIIKTEKNTIIGDYYNANPSSMLVAIENIAKLDADKKVLILGDMFELGEEATTEHEMIIQKVLSYHFYQVIFIGDEFLKLNELSKAEFFKTTDEAVIFLQKNPISNALVLLKGSRSMHLEGLMSLL